MTIEVPPLVKQDSFDSFAAALSLNSLDALPPSQVPSFSKCDSFDTFCDFNATVVTPPDPAPVQPRKRPRHRRSHTDPEALRRVSDLNFLNSSFGDTGMDLSDTLRISDIDKDSQWIDSVGFVGGHLSGGDSWMANDFKPPPFLVASSSTDSKSSMMGTIEENLEDDYESDEDTISIEATLKRKARMEKMRRRRSHRRTNSDDEIGRRRFKKVCGTKRKQPGSATRVKFEVGTGKELLSESGRPKRQASRHLSWKPSNSSKGTAARSTKTKTKTKPPARDRLDKLKGLAEVAQNAAASLLDDDAGIGRGKYKCSRCGQPKEGHVCPVVEARSIDTQCDLSVTGCPEFFARLSLGPRIALVHG